MQLVTEKVSNSPPGANRDAVSWPALSTHHAFEPKAKRIKCCEKLNGRPMEILILMKWTCGKDELV